MDGAALPLSPGCAEGPPLPEVLAAVAITADVVPGGGNLGPFACTKTMSDLSQRISHAVTRLEFFVCRTAQGVKAAEQVGWC